MALQRTRRLRSSFAKALEDKSRSGRSLRSLGSPLTRHPFGRCT